MHCERCGISLSILSFIPEYKGRVLCSECVVSDLMSTDIVIEK